MNEFLKDLTDEIQHFKSISKTPFGDGYLSALESAKRWYERRLSALPPPEISDWIDSWLKANIVTDVSKMTHQEQLVALDAHAEKTTYSRAIAIELYRKMRMGAVKEIPIDVMKELTEAAQRIVWKSTNEFVGCQSHNDREIRMFILGATEMTRHINPLFTTTGPEQADKTDINGNV